MVVVDDVVVDGILSNKYIYIQSLSNAAPVKLPNVSHLEAIGKDFTPW